MLPENHQNRNLSEVFKELQKSREQFLNNSNPDKFSQINHTKKINKKYNTSIIIKRTILFSLCIIFLLLLFVSSNSIFAKDDLIPVAKQEEPIAFESNENAIDITNIIRENIGANKTKEVVNEEREIPFEVVKKESASLPKGEEVITQEGKNGKEQVTAVKTYSNNEFVEETITNRIKLEDYTPQIIEVGTSEFLAKHKVHIGDTMYATTTTLIRESPNSTAKEIDELKMYLDVKLLEMFGEDWCKVSLDGKEGFVESSKITSSTTTPTIVERNRKQRLLLTLEFNMPLNKPSGLTLKDFKKVLSGNSSDINKIFETHAEDFYEIEQKYNVNGIFLAAVAVHESAWGTSSISVDKKNLFGYGSYDRDPYNSSYVFEDYKEGIELVAKVFSKYYLNPSGTKIYDNEIAVATYYNGPTLSGVNIKYSTDEDWCIKVYRYMENFYNKI